MYTHHIYIHIIYIYKCDIVRNLMPCSKSQDKDDFILLFLSLVFLYNFSPKFFTCLFSNKYVLIDYKSTLKTLLLY